jgi:hypothetical protein
LVVGGEAARGEAIDCDIKGGGVASKGLWLDLVMIRSKVVEQRPNFGVGKVQDE